MHLPLDFLQGFAPAGVDVQIFGKMFLLSVLGFIAGRWLFENVAMPLPKFNTWNKLSFTHFVWTQVWTSYLLWTAWQNVQ